MRTTVSVGFLERLDHQSTDLLTTMFARSRIAKAVIDLGPGRRGLLADVNPAFCALTGRDHDAMPGKPWRLPLRAQPGRRLRFRPRPDLFPWKSLTRSPGSYQRVQ